MLACIFILILILPAAFLSLALETLFSPGELSDMGVCLEGTHSPPPLPPDPSTARPCSQRSCLLNGLSI